MAEIAMKRVLLLLDSDPIPNAYDVVIVAYDGGADHGQYERLGLSP